MEGYLETYKLFSTVGGVNNQLDVSRFSQRFSFLANFDQIQVVPFPHLNLVNLVGMSQKQQYLIWREKHGFFTALNRENELQTWSLVTGKLLYTIPLEEDNSDYTVYRADPNDQTYIRNYYNFENRTVQLLTQTKMGAEANSQEMEEVLLDNKLDKATLNAKNISQLRQSLVTGDKDMKVQIKETQIDLDIFNFKAMELTTYEDNG